ncbi:nucleoprotein TPR-like isoform X2 [Bacillus rossius redtenbacheri]|uniref:nucleoprotein TPR-like isoform X2 n=1 Tax=Bacillus rossius redtenbacheri TaxID=93214 RepID=UPI002FDD1500
MAFAGNLVPDAISIDEGNQIPQDIFTKIERYMKTIVETNCALRDTWRSKEEQYENKISGYERDLAEGLGAVAVEREKQREWQAALRETEAQLELSRSELSAEQQRRKELEAEARELRNTEAAARQEGAALQGALALAGADVRRLEERCKGLSVDLQRAADAKYEALAKSREQRHAAEALGERQDRLELQLLALRRHNKDLAGCAGRYRADLASARRDYSDKLTALEAQLLARTDECARQTRAADGLRTSLGAAEDMVQKLGARLNAQQQAQVGMKEGFAKELRAVTEVMNIYKRLSEEGEGTMDEVLARAREMSQELEAAVGKCVSAEEKQARSEAELRRQLSEKDRCIAGKEQELKATYELVAATVKQEVTEAVEGTPAESELRRQLRDCGSVANFIQHCAGLSEKVRTLKQENKYHLMFRQKLLEEVEARAPLLRKQREDCERALGAVLDQSQQLDALGQEARQSRDREARLQEQVSRLDRENYCLRSQAADLGKQVCHLLREVELARAGKSSSPEELSENLVVFGNVEELQEKNRKLLEMFAELNMTVESAGEADGAAASEESVSVASQLQDLREELEGYKSQARSLVAQRDAFRRLYERQVYGRRPPPVEEAPAGCSVEELTEQLAVKDRELEALRVASVSLERAREAGEHAARQERARLLEELGAAGDRAARLDGQLQVCRQQLQRQEETLSAARQRATSLEVQNSSYCSRAADDQRAIKYFKEAAQKAAQQQELAERQRGDVEARDAAQGEGDGPSRQAQRLQELLERLEAAGTALQHREEARGAGPMEQLNKAYQECLALSRHLQAERRLFEEERARLLTDLDGSLKKLLAERERRGMLETQLKAALGEVEGRSREVAELGKLLAESRLASRPAAQSPPVFSGTPEVDGWRRRAEELEAQLGQERGETDLLQQRLEDAQGRATTFSDMSERFERQWQEEADKRRSAWELYDHQLSEARQVEAGLRAEVAELSDAVDRLTGDGSEPVVQLQEQLRVTQQERDALRTELQSVQALRDTLQDMEEKLHREELAHATDNQAVARLKEELAAASGQLATLAAEKQAAETALAGRSEQWAREKAEVMQDLSGLQERLSELEGQNALLHDQLEALSARASASASASVRKPQDARGTAPAGPSTSGGSADVEEARSRAELMKIIKFLRKEKKALAGKLSEARGEVARATVRLEELQRQSRAAAQSGTEGQATAACEQEERIKKAELLCAVQESNGALRAERDALAERADGLAGQLERAARELGPLRAAQRGLQQQVEQLAVEGRAAREEAARLRRQYARLVDSTARANQQEREALGRRLAAETAALGHAREELAALREQVEELERQHAEEVQELRGQMAASQQRNLHVTKKLSDCRSELAENNCVIDSLREKLSAKEMQLGEMLRKERQLEEARRKGEEQKMADEQTRLEEQKKEQASRLQEETKEEKEMGLEEQKKEQATRLQEETKEEEETALEEPGKAVAAAARADDGLAGSVSLQEVAPQSTEQSERPESPGLARQRDPDTESTPTSQRASPELLGPSATPAAESQQVMEVECSEVAEPVVSSRSPALISAEVVGPSSGVKRPREDDDRRSSDPELGGEAVLQVKRSCVVEAESCEALPSQEVPRTELQSAESELAGGGVPDGSVQAEGVGSIAPGRDGSDQSAGTAAPEAVVVGEHKVEGQGAGSRRQDSAGTASPSPPPASGAEDISTVTGAGSSAPRPSLYPVPPVLRYRGTPVRIVRVRSLGGRPLGRVVFRGRARGRDAQ